MTPLPESSTLPLLSFSDGLTASRATTAGAVFVATASKRAETSLSSRSPYLAQAKPPLPVSRTADRPPAKAQTPINNAVPKRFMSARPPRESIRETGEGAIVAGRDDAQFYPAVKG